MTLTRPTRNGRWCYSLLDKETLKGTRPHGFDVFLVAVQHDGRRGLGRHPVGSYIHQGLKQTPEETRRGQESAKRSESETKDPKEQVGCVK